MAPKRSLRIDLRIWATLAEPRTVTATMIFVYTMIVAFSVLSLLHGSLTQGIVIGCVVMLAGGVLGIPAAWRGVWAVEGLPLPCASSASAILRWWISCALSALATCPVIPSRSR